MKYQKITYWVTTSLFAGMMALSAVNYFSEEFIQSFVHLGFPDYFRVELAFAKILGAIILLIPMINGRIKEWAYVGFGLTLISAAIAHLSLGDPLDNTIAPLVFFGILTTSYYFHHKLMNLDKVTA